MNTLLNLNLFLFRRRIRRPLLAPLALALLLASCTATMPVAVTSTPLDTCDLIGEAKCTCIFGVWVKTDCSITTAMANGKIAQACTVEQKVSRSLFRQDFTTIVHGRR